MFELINEWVLLVRSLPPLVGRLVPFVACSAANCINIPLMRRLELTEVGRILMTENNDLKVF